MMIVKLNLINKWLSKKGAPEYFYPVDVLPHKLDKSLYYLKGDNKNAYCSASMYVTSMVYIPF